MTTMKKLPHATLVAFLALCLAFIMTACGGVTYGLITAEGEKNAFMDAYATWKAGHSTFNDMKKVYDAPNDYADTENGFAVRWIRKSKVVSNTSSTGINPALALSRSETSRPNHYSTVTSALEAFFDKNGVLTSFRIQMLD